MRPYYEHAGVTIYHGNSLQIMPTLDSFDLVATDPPYVDLVGGYKRTFSGGVSEINQPSFSVGDLWNANFEWVELAWNKCVSGMIVFCGHKDVASLRASFPDQARTIALLTWYKRNAAPTGKNVVRFTSEFAWALAKVPGLKWDELKTTVFDIPNANAGCMATERFVESDGSASHPSQKPVSLMNELLRVAIGKSVLDPFMGTGSTLESAKALGISATGIELEERYCEIAAKRLAQEVFDFATREQP